MGYSRLGVPFGLPVENKSYWGAPVEAGVLVLDQDVNLMQRIQDEKIKTFFGNAFKDGWHYFNGFHSFGTNTFKINPGAFTLDGKVSQWLGVFTIDNQITLPAAGGSPRTDLVWIEQWLEEVDSGDGIYPHGNVDYFGGTEANDIVDPAVGSACTNRVQIRYRTRITPNASDLSDAACTAQGAQGTPGSTTFSFDATKNNWLAGTGDTSYSLLDGKVHALPICTILRPASDDTVYEANVSDIRLHNSLNTATTKFISSNVLIGSAAGLALGSASGCTFVGHHAGVNVTGAYNTGVGHEALKGDVGGSSGYSNTCVGDSTGLVITSGYCNTLIGRNTGVAITEGSSNTFVGDGVGDNISTGNNNTFMGQFAGFQATGSYNTFVGANAGRCTTAMGGVFIGYSAGEDTTSGGGNVFIGYQAGKTNTTSSNNSFIGYNAGANVTGANNTSIGFEALKGDAGGSSATQNICLGGGTGFSVTTAHDNVFIGYNAGNSVTSGDCSIFIGSNSGTNVVEGDYNIFIGINSGDNVIGGVHNVFIGYDTGQAVTSGNYNTFVGDVAGYNLTGTYNTCLGYNTGQFVNSTNYNTYLGFASGFWATDGPNTFVGANAGAYAQSAHGVYVGHGAGESVWDHPGTGGYNVFVGEKAGQLVEAGAENICIGYRAGANLGAGECNTLIGYAAGAIITGNRNILIGYAAGSTMGGVNNRFVVSSTTSNRILQGNMSTLHLGVGCVESTYFSLRVNGHFGPYSDDAFDIGSNMSRWDNIWATNGVIQTCDVTQKIVHTDKADLGLDFINHLKPIAFTWKDRDIAEETKHVKYEQQKMNKVIETIITATTELRDGKHVKVMKNKEVEREVPEVEIVNLYDEQNNVIGTHEKSVMETIEYDEVITPAKSFRYTRTHYGLSAQDVKQALDALGIDTNDFAGYIHDPESGTKALRITEFIPPMIKAIQELSAKIETLKGT